MAKVPIKGEVKTRLAPFVGGDTNALEIYKSFLKDISFNLSNLDNSLNIDKFLFYDQPDNIVQGESSKNLLRDFFSDDYTYKAQIRGDLGEKIENVFFEVFEAGYKSVVIIGSDSPDLPLKYIEDGFTYLAQDAPAMSIGPASDGGYYLIGLNKLEKSLFKQVSWSSDKVFNETIEKAKLANIKLNILPKWYDVDDLDGLRRVMAENKASKTIKLLNNLKLTL